MSTLSRTRPGEDRWIDPKVFTKPNLQQGEYGWLGLEWWAANDYKDPTVSDILEGIQK